MKIYFASPWFCEAQEEREERLKAKLRSLGYEVHSPKEDSNISGSFSDPEYRHKVFQSNIDNIKCCDIIFGVCDGKRALVVEPDQMGKIQQCIDSGTIFECGVAYNMRQSSNTNIPLIVYYAETLGNMQFNLMLQESADVVITSFEDMDNFTKYIDDALKGIRKIHNGETE